jgi:hypothetical protein
LNEYGKQYWRKLDEMYVEDKTQQKLCKIYVFKAVFTIALWHVAEINSYEKSSDDMMSCPAGIRPD